MKLVEKDNKDADPVHLPWDAAIAALATGAFEVLVKDGERGPDVPAAQSPAPGTDPFDRTMQTFDSEKTPNMTGVATPGATSAGLPTEPVPSLKGDQK